MISADIIRMSFFLGMLFAMACWETFFPKRLLNVSRLTRWSNNLVITFMNSMVIRLFIPISEVSVAFYAKENHLGLFNQLAFDNEWLVMMLSIVILDAVIYFQHRLFHRMPLLWRVHRVHHVDLDIDVTTGVRFHTIEIIISLLIKCIAIMLIGAPVMAVLIFSVLLNITSMFSHGNVRMPFIVDKIIRWVIVTPDMHRVHHSDIPSETDSNYGFNLSIWDRLFRTYQAQPALGHANMVIGIKTIRETKYCVYLLGMLRLPFINSR